MSEKTFAAGTLKSGMVAIVGETNAGKSTLLNALLGTKLSIVASKPHTTRNRVLGILNEEQGQIVLVDTPGFVRSSAKNQMGKFTSRVLREAVSGVDLLLVLIDATVFAGHTERVQQLLATLQEQHMGTPAVIALNKVDIVRKDLLLPLIAEFDRRFKSAGREDVDIVPISALKHDGLDRLLDVLWQKLPEGDMLFPPDMLSDQSDRFLAGEIVREKMIAVLEQELPHSAAVQVESWEEDDRLIQIQAVLLVEKESQKAIVIGKGGRRIKQIGEAARLELEDLFEQKVFLKLFVRVEPEWTKTERGLARAGYELS